MKTILFLVLTSLCSAAVTLPKPLQGIGIAQKLNAQVPLDTTFQDESGQTVKLADYMGHRPAILALIYYTCPALCDQILHGVVDGLRPLSLHPGRDFTFIAISINPQETPADAAAKRTEFVNIYSRGSSTDGWHFLTGTEQNIHAVADSLGYRYRYDPKSKMYFHGAAIMVLTPHGKAARYLYGIEYQPKDLKLALVEASENHISSPVDQILLFCYHYDPLTGKYTARVLNMVRVVGAIFMTMLALLLGFLWRGDFHFTHRSHTEIPRL